MVTNSNMVHKETLL